MSLAETNFLFSWTGWRINTHSPRGQWRIHDLRNCPAIAASWTRECSASLEKFWTAILVEPSRDNRKLQATFVAERQEAIEEAPRLARGDPQGCTECRRSPLRA